MSSGIPCAVLARGRTPDELNDILAAGTAISRGQVARGSCPPWWESRAVYRREAHETLPGVERIQTMAELDALGYGDCDDHACSLAGSLQAYGIPARAVVMEAPGVGWHAVVVTRDADGELVMVDPSAARGMYEPEIGASDRRRRRGAAALRALGTTLSAAERLAPGSRARRLLIEQAARLARMARDADEPEPDETENEDE